MKRKVKRTLMMKFFDIGMKLSRYYCQKCTSVLNKNIEEQKPGVKKRKILQRSCRNADIANNSHRENLNSKGSVKEGHCMGQHCTT